MEISTIQAAFQTWSNGGVQVSSLSEGEAARTFVERSEDSGSFAHLHTFTSVEEGRAAHAEWSSAD